MKLKKKELDNLKALVEKMSTKQNEIGLIWQMQYKC